MRAKLALSAVLLGLAVALAPHAATAAVPRQAPFPQAAGEPTCPGNGGLVKADVVALDQAIVLNRLGASLPNGMIFALAEDVCTPGGPVIDGQPTCGTGKPGVGKVMLRPGKRPRPLVLRVDQGQCLEITFTNLLNSTAQAVTVPPGNTQTQPSTRAASVHVQGMEWVKDANDDGSWVGANSNSLVSPGGAPHIYTLYAAHEGSFLLYSTGDTYSNPGGVVNSDGGQLSFGLFGAVHVEPKGAEWYRSQVSADDLKLATRGFPTPGQPILDYHAVYPAGHAQAGLPILNMVTCPNETKEGCPFGGRIVHSDLTALIAGRQPDGQPGSFPADSSLAPVFNPAYALPDRLQPYREFTIIYHEMFQSVQAFDQMYSNALNVDGNGADNYAFNYGTGGIASEILANRLGVGPMGNCPSCKYEEFFLTSWAVGDPAMVVDHPATDSCTPGGLCDDNKTSCDPDLPNPNQACPVTSATAAKARQVTFTGTCNFNGKYSCDTKQKATRAFYPDDPSNVYHSYISDHTKFRVLHAGLDLHHVHHQHAHQWLHSPDTPNGYYTDSQTFGPGSAFTLEMVYNGSGNVNQTVGDSIFHCHFYPHFAGGMWSLWRVHDVLETGTPMKDARPVPGQRALPDGEIASGTPIPAVVPLPSLPMAPAPGFVKLTPDGTQYEVCNQQGANCVSPFASTNLDPRSYSNPGYPFFIPGIGGQRAPHPPLDFAHENPDDPRSAALDGGLPRHLIRGCADPSGKGCATTPPLNSVDFSKTLEKVSAFQLPEGGTGVEQLAMAYHGQRFHATVTQSPKPQPAQFILNGLPPVAGAPYADPCINFSRNGGKPAGLVTRRYKAADIQLDAVFNKEGWHFPQQRMLALWGDVQDTLAGKRAPEPLFFRANSGECIEYTLANLVPNVYELDDFQVRTPTDILGQHIHLVKFDVTSSDGATNGFNYEDGTFSPDEVTERIRAINAGGGLAAGAGNGAPTRQLTATALPFFGPGPGGRWLGAQATIQRWYADPLFDGPRHDPPAALAVDRTLRTVFTHDHFGPSTHQQAGLYAGLVIEPKGSQWYGNETQGAPFGGVDAAGQPLPGRTVTGAGGPPVRDGGPTTWQAVVETPNKAASFREFVFAVQDTTLTYSPFANTIVNPAAGKGWCSAGGGACTPATATSPASGCSGVCYAYGFCSNNTKLLCKLATWQSDEDVSACNYAQATCNTVAGVPGQVVAYQPLNVFGPSGKATVLPNIATWGTLPIDAPNKVAAEIITLAGGSNSFSMNYRNEPLYPRIIDPTTQKPSTSGTLGDLAFAYTSQTRPWLTGTGPYPPLTPGLLPGDPFTPLMRSYAGDDVQVRTLVTGQINPHNLAIHGVHWLSQPGWDDSGWRGSQVMGISEHFEQIFRLPSWVSTPTAGTGKQADYLMMAGAAAIEQAGGNWSLLRAYGDRRNDLRALPQNQNPAQAASLPVCPARVTPPHQNRTYTVVALSGSLTYTSLQGGTVDPNAILYYKMEDLNCPGGTPSASCTPRSSTPAPLVLRANAGDCVTVKLYNYVTTAKLPAGASAPNLPAPAQTNPPTFALTCGASCLPSNTSSYVGLHPQLPTFDASTSDGFNVGANPVQTAVANSGVPATYTWYAGNVDVRNPANPYIPIELGASNLLPSDVVNHYQHGLFGALVIEPEGATGWQASDGVEAHVRTASLPAFHEFVLATQDGLANPPTPAGTLGAAALNGVNYQTMIPNFSGIACTTAGDVSCILSNTAQCCSTALANGACPSGKSVACNQGHVPTLTACAGEPVRFRLLHPGGVITNEVFELYGHVWTETPYESVGLGCAPQTTQTNLYASSIVSNQRGCTAEKLQSVLPAAKLPVGSIITKSFLASYGAQKDSLSIWQGSRSGHGPGNHFDVLIEKAGGSNAVTGDYLFRTYSADQFLLGLWGIFRVESCKQSEATTPVAPAISTSAAEGGSR